MRFRSHGLMKRVAASRIAILLLTAACFAVSIRPADATTEELKVGGTGSALANIETLANAFSKTHPSIETKVVPSLGSSGGINALLAGELDIAVSSRPLKDKEAAQGAVAFEYARTPFVFATHSTAANGFTLQEIVRIYSGNLTAWPDGTPIRTVMRPAAESDTFILRSISDDMDRAVDIAAARPGMIETLNDQENATVLENVAGTVGTITLGQLISEDRNLRPLAINGVTPTVATAISGQYPYAKSQFLVTRADKSPIVQQFVAFIHSPMAQQIMDRQGYWMHDQYLEH